MKTKLFRLCISFIILSIIVSFSLFCGCKIKDEVYPDNSVEEENDNSSTSSNQGGGGLKNGGIYEAH